MSTLSKACLAGCAALLFVACTDNTTKDPHAKLLGEDKPAILYEIDALNDRCRGGSGDDPKTEDACRKRELKIDEAQRQGWCWGPMHAIGADKRWMRCRDDSGGVAADSAPVLPTREWFAHNINHSQCIQANSPASRIRSIQENGQVARTADLPNGGVEVERDIGGGRSEVFTFYPSMATCIASLPRSHAIPGRYE